MSNYLTNVIRPLDTVIRGLIATGIFLILLIICLQVFFRFALNNALPWPEEASRFLTIWALLLGGAYAYAHHEHANVDYLFKRFPKLIQKYLGVLVHFLILLFFAYLVIGGWTLMENIGSMPTGALRISRGIPLAAIPVSAVLYGLISIRHITKILLVDH